MVDKENAKEQLVRCSLFISVMYWKLKIYDYFNSTVFHKEHLIVR